METEGCKCVECYGSSRDCMCRFCDSHCLGEGCEKVIVNFKSAIDENKISVNKKHFNLKRLN